MIKLTKTLMAFGILLLSPLRPQHDATIRVATDCEDCQLSNSLISPAVYFQDLTKLILENFDQNKFSDITGLQTYFNQNFKELYRTPQGRKQSTSDEYKYVKLGNEVLANYYFALTKNRRGAFDISRSNLKDIYDEFKGIRSTGDTVNIHVLAQLFDNYVQLFGTDREELSYLDGVDANTLQGFLSRLDLKSDEFKKLAVKNLDIDLNSIDQVKGVLEDYILRRASREITADYKAEIFADLQTEYYRQLTVHTGDLIRTEMVNKIRDYKNGNGTTNEVVIDSLREVSVECIQTGGATCQSSNQDAFDPISYLFEIFAQSYTDNHGRILTGPQKKSFAETKVRQLENELTDLVRVGLEAEDIDATPEMISRQVKNLKSSEEQISVLLEELAVPTLKLRLNSDSAFKKEFDDLTQETYSRQYISAIRVAENGILSDIRNNLIYLILTKTDANSREEIENTLYLSLSSTETNTTTPLSFAINRLHTFIQRTQLGLTDTEIAQGKGETFNGKWRWMQSYGIWHAALTVDLFPDNFLFPEIRPDQTYIFSNIARQIEDNDQLTDFDHLYEQYAAEVGLLSGMEILFANEFDNNSLVLARSINDGKFYYSIIRSDRSWKPWMILEGLGKTKSNTLSRNSTRNKPFEAEKAFYFHIRGDELDIFLWRSNTKPIAAQCASNLTQYEVNWELKHAAVLVDNDELSTIKDWQSIEFEGDNSPISRAKKTHCQNSGEYKKQVESTLFGAFSARSPTFVDIDKSGVRAKVRTWELSYDDEKQAYQVINKSESLDNVSGVVKKIVGVKSDNLNRDYLIGFSTTDDRIDIKKGSGTALRAIVNEPGNLQASETLGTLQEGDFKSGFFGAITGLVLDAVNKEMVYYSAPKPVDQSFPTAFIKQRQSDEWEIIIEENRSFSKIHHMWPLGRGKYAMILNKNPSAGGALHIAYFDDLMSRENVENLRNQNLIRYENLSGNKDVLLNFSNNLSPNARFQNTSKSQYPRVFLDEYYLFLPMLLGEVAQSRGDYKEARKWYSKVYDPLVSEGGSVFKYPAFDDTESTSATLDEPFRPYEKAIVNKKYLKRHVVVSYVSNILDWADEYFLQETAESVNRARVLYELANNILETNYSMINECGSEDPGLSPLTILGLSFDDNSNFCIGLNPLYNLMAFRVSANLLKINTNKNFAGFTRQLEPYARPVDPNKAVRASASLNFDFDRIIPTTPPPVYRYSFLMERSRQLIANASQFESYLLSTLEKEDSETYSLQRARQDLKLEQANVKLQNLRLTESRNSRRQVVSQARKVRLRQQRYGTLINKGLSSYEKIGLALSLTSTTVPASVGVNIGYPPSASISYSPSGILQTLASMSYTKASYDRRKEEWRFQKNLADIDLDVASIAEEVADDRIDIVTQEREIGEMRVGNANDVLEFLNEKFTNVDLYKWMAKNLKSLYRQQLSFAISTAKSAQRALEFERQVSLDFIGDDYWVADRKGLLGAERLLNDLEKLEQYRLQTDVRKQEISKNIYLSHSAPLAFQRFKETGMLDFETIPEWFDRDFPGTYLRLVKNVEVSVVALVPNGQSVNARLSSPGISRVVTGAPFDNYSIVHRQPETISISSTSKSTGLFQLNFNDPKLLPFEGMGVAAQWQFEMPKGANQFEFDNILDVVFTINYTALYDGDYKRKVLEKMGQDDQGKVRVNQTRYYSLAEMFPDQWYDLVNDNSYEGEYKIDGQEVQVLLNTENSDFLANEEGRRIRRVVIAGIALEDNATTGNIELTLKRCSPAPLQSKTIPIQLQANREYIERTAAFSGKSAAGTWVLAFKNKSDLAKLRDLMIGIEYEAKVDYPK